MKKTLLSILTLSAISFSCMAVEVSNVKVTAVPVSEIQSGQQKVAFSSTTRDILVDENFEGLTSGTMDEPSFGDPLASLDYNIEIDPELTHGDQWYGHKVYEAGGALAMQSLSMDQCILNTPRMDYSGSVRLTFLTKALKSEWKDEEGKLMEDYSAHLIVGISDEQGRKIDVNATSNLADLQMYADMGWMEVTVEFDNYSAYNGVSIVFAGTRSLLLDDIKVSVSNDEFIAVPYVTGVSDVTEDSFTIHWEKVRKSYNYYVWLYTDGGVDPETGEQKYDIVFPKQLMDQINATPDYTVEDYVEAMGGINSPYLKYDIVNRHGDLSYTFTDLDPEKDYYFAVMSHNVSMFSDKKLIKQSVLGCPELYAATNFTNNSFTANWSKITKADFYEVNLSGVEVVEESNDSYEIFKEDFEKTSSLSNAEDFNDATPCSSTMTLDDMATTKGWEINGPLALEIPDMGDMPLCYMLDGWFGPGMNMTLSTPSVYVGNCEYVDITMRLQCANESAPIVLQFAGGMYMADMGGMNEAIAELRLPTYGLEETRLDIACMDPEGLPLFIDYISMTQPLEKGDIIYHPLSTSQVSAENISFAFENLDETPFDVYAYSVAAGKYDGRRSASSEKVLIDFRNQSPYSVTSIIKAKISNEIVEVARFSLDGSKLNGPTQGVNIIRYSDGSTRKVVVK